MLVEGARLVADREPGAVGGRPVEVGVLVAALVAVAKHGQSCRSTERELADDEGVLVDTVASEEAEVADGRVDA